MDLRGLAVALAVAATLSACASDPAAGPGTGEGPGGTSGADLTATAQLALSATDGEPLIDPAELLDGASYDGIPAVDDPLILSAQQADAALVDDEQVMLVEQDGEARAYPVRSLIRHEIFNDELAGRPVLVTWCPLCNTGIAFDRRVDGQVERFGVSGQLYRSALVMFDRRTQSLWPQPVGVAALGPLLGTELEVLPSSLLPWREVRRAYPDLTVALGAASELEEARNPYQGYDTSGTPFLFQGDTDQRLPAFTRVAGITVDEVSRAYSYDLLRRKRAIDAELEGVPLVVLWSPGSASPLDTDDVRNGRDVGSAAIYDRRLGDRVLTFAPAGGEQFRDRETGSRWTIAGLAVDGPLEGQRLTRRVHQDAFWFAWAAFQPDTEVVAELSLPRG